MKRKTLKFFNTSNSDLIVLPKASIIPSAQKALFILGNEGAVTKALKNRKGGKAA